MKCTRRDHRCKIRESRRGKGGSAHGSAPTGRANARPMTGKARPKGEPIQPLPGSNYFAEADCSAGLPKTLRQPWLRLERCLCMQAVIRSTLGISDIQSRKTSPVQSRR